MEIKRVLVAEDSLTARRQIIEVLSAAPDLEVVGEAEDGKRAIELCQELRPDVVTMDMILPAMSGLAATEYIMAYCPTPILVVSSSTNRGELFKTYEALAAGAVDVLEKPNGTEPEGEWERKLVSAVRMVSRIRVITHPRGRIRSRGVNPPPLEPPAAASDTTPRLIAIGASTGGPGAVLEVLRSLPATFHLPCLVVVHIGRLFAAAFADWLDTQVDFAVTYASDGERLPVPGERRVVLAPPDVHMLVDRGRLRLVETPARHHCRPAVDVLFESLASEHGPETVACLLTGMGRDGAAGLLAIRTAGGTTIAQDEASSVVFGMPREAILLGAAERVLPLGQIGSELAALSTARTSRRPR